MRQSWAHKQSVFRTLFCTENSGESPGVFSVLLQKCWRLSIKFIAFAKGSALGHLEVLPARAIRRKQPGTPLQNWQSRPASPLPEGGFLVVLQDTLCYTKTDTVERSAQFWNGQFTALRTGSFSMIILGIDPGYAIVGYGVVRYDNRTFTPVAYGAVTTEALAWNRTFVWNRSTMGSVPSSTATSPRPSPLSSSFSPTTRPPASWWPRPVG